MTSPRSAMERVFRPGDGDLPPNVAATLLAFDLTAADRARYAELSERAQLGTLSEEERVELDDLLTTNDVLTILHAKARSSLGKAPSAA